MLVHSLAVGFAIGCEVSERGCLAAGAGRWVLQVQANLAASQMSLFVSLSSLAKVHKRERSIGAAAAASAS